MSTPDLARLAPFIPKELRTVSLDPGQTTGWSIWVGLERQRCGQQIISDIEVFLDDIETDFTGGFDQLVIENYRTYASKAKVQGALYTPRLIGRIESWAEHNNVPLTKQMASCMKFCSDVKLKDWNLWVPGQRHAMDATAHACFFFIFNYKKGVSG